MKKLHILSIITVLALLASTAPASALSLGATVNGNASLSDDRSDTTISSQSNASISNRRGDDGRDDADYGRGMMNANINAMMNANMEHWKTWMFNGGITGTVTAVNGSVVTIKGANGTVYTVTTTDANIRYANGGTAIQTGDHVYVQGAVNGTSVVATMLIDAKTGTATPPANDTRNAIAGTVTAKSGTTLTVLTKNGTSYTVNATNASVWKTGHQSSSVSDISVGEAVVVQGTVTGSSVTATQIMAITFPAATANGGIHGTVTAINDSTITILATNGATYSVNTANATYSDRKGDDEQRSNISVGDSIVVNGDVNGSTISASSITEAKANIGFFARIGGFFRHLFGRK